MIHSQTDEDITVCLCGMKLQEFWTQAVQHVMAVTFTGASRLAVPLSQIFQHVSYHGTQPFVLDQVIATMQRTQVK